MKTFLRFLMLATLMVVGCSFAFAQGPAVDTTGLSGWNPFENPVTVGDMQDAYNTIYGALVIVWGYVARLFGWRADKVPFVFVVAGGGAVIAGVFLALGWADAIPLVISFFLSLGLFDTILKPGEKVVKRVLRPSR